MSDLDNFLDHGERRLATVLFADISGFTTLSEQMDPEDVTILVNKCFEILGSIIEENEGTIDKFIGDCIMAVFGIPTAIEDSPRKAINAAIEMRNSFENYNKSNDIDIPLSIHIGINTGGMVAGLVGSDDKKEYTVIGDTVNIASRLKDESGDGQIFVGPETYRLTKQFYRFTKTKALNLKGKKERFSAFEVISNKSKLHRKPPDKNRMVYSDMIGRDRELNLLKNNLQNLVSQKKGSIVSLIGEAGMGKSRMIAELMQWEPINQVNVLQGRSLSYGQNLSYYPVIDILKQWIGINEKDTEGSSRRKLELAIRKIYPEKMQDLLPFISRLLSIPLSESDLRRIKDISEDALEKLILKSLRDLIEKSSSTRPTLIILEDIHWADLTSIEFFKSFFRAANRNPIMFVILFRPNYPDTSGYLQKNLKRTFQETYQEILLQPLDDLQRQDLLKNLLKNSGLPQKIFKSIGQRSEGNPFFIEEIIRSFIDDEIIKINNGKWEITDKINTLAIPSSINELLLGRIDKLEDSTRSLLKIASVIGRNFYYKILVEISGESEKVDKRLSYLEDLQLLRKHIKLLELEYFFRHALVHEVTYESILLTKRKQLHLQTALVIESIFEDRIKEFYGVLALHYSKGEAIDQAEKYLIKAGEEAMNLSASSEVLYNFKEALNIYLNKHGELADPEMVIMMEKKIAFAYHAKGRFNEALSSFDKILQFYKVKSPQGKIPSLLATINGVGHIFTGVYLKFLKWKKVPDEQQKELIRIFFIRLNEMGVAAPKRLVAESMIFYQRLTTYDLTKIEGGVGLFAGASVIFTLSGISFSFARKILTFTEGLVDNSDIRSYIYVEFARVLNAYMSGRFEYYREPDYELIESGLRIGETLYTSYYVNMHVLSNLEFGNYDTVLRLVKILDEIGDKFDHQYAKELRYYDLTRLLFRHGDIDLALKESDRDLHYLSIKDDVTHMPRSYAIRAQILMEKGDMEGAKEFIKASKKLKLTIPVNLFTYEMLVTELIYDVEMMRIAMEGRSDVKLRSKRAQKSLTNAIKISKKVAPCQPEVFLQAGIFFWTLKRRRRAINYWQKSINVAVDQGAKINLARIYGELGKRLLKESIQINGLEGDWYKQESERIYIELETHWNKEAVQGLIKSD